MSSSKKTLQYQAEEGARLAAENKELQFRLAQLKENHTYECTVTIEKNTAYIHVHNGARFNEGINDNFMQGECTSAQR